MVSMAGIAPACVSLTFQRVRSARVYTLINGIAGRIRTYVDFRQEFWRLSVLTSHTLLYFEIGSAPRYCPGYIFVPNEADYFLPRALYLF
jgi:hypothetical protein